MTGLPQQSENGQKFFTEFYQFSAVKRKIFQSFQKGVFSHYFQNYYTGQDHYAHFRWETEKERVCTSSGLKPRRLLNALSSWKQIDE